MNRTFMTAFISLIFFLSSVCSYGHVALPPQQNPDNKGKPCPTGECCPQPASGAPGQCCSTGAPQWEVNKINSNLFVSDIPLWYSPAVGPKVTAQLAYNSKAPTTGTEIFGNKWTFGYGGYLQSDAAGNVTIFMADGREDTFTANGSGGFNQACSCDTYMELTQINDSHFELQTRAGTTFIYSIAESAGTKLFLSEIKDVHNQSLYIGYSANQLTTLTDALAQVTTLHYNSDGLVEKVTDPFGREALFDYDTNRNLTSLTDIGGYQTTVEYRETGLLKALVNQGGRTEFYIEPATTVASWIQYPEPGTEMGASSRITITHPDGGKEEFYYNGVNATSWHVTPGDYRDYYAPNNNFSTEVPKTIYTFADTVKGVRANIGSITYPSGEKTIYGYDSTTGKLNSIADAAGNTRSMTHNDKGRIATRTTTGGIETRYFYDSNDLDVVRIEDDLGATTMIYNSQHQITSQTNRAQQTTLYSYNQYGQLNQITDPLNIITVFNYNANHRLSSVTRDGKTLSSMTYDAIGRVATSSDATGLLLNYAYDDLNHLTSITYPDGKTESWQFNSPHSPHLKTAATSRSGDKTSYKYDQAKNLVNSINPANFINRFTYDLNDNPVQFNDANSNPTVFDYDAGNRLVKRTYADGKSLSYTYYNTGLLATETNGRGQTTTYYYDANLNLLSVDYEDEATPDIAFSYDIFARLDQVEDGSGITVFTYDSSSRIKTINGPLESDTITYSYDALGRVSTIQLENGQTRTHIYDTLGRLEKIQFQGSEYSYEYNDDVSPLIKTLTRPNGTSTTYSYDTLNRLLGVSNQGVASSTINSYTYTYNAKDLRGSETITGGLAAPPLTDELIHSDFNTVNQLLENHNPDETFVYDDDGNMIEGFTSEGYRFTAVYDEADRLASLSYTDADNKNHLTQYTYRYDSFLTGIRKYQDTVLVDDIRIVRSGHLALQERDSSNTVVREYVWGQNLGGGIGGLLQLNQESATYSYLYDGKGNVVSVLDSTGTEVVQYQYNSFGKKVAQAGSLDQPFQFSTKRYDELTGLNYYGYRFYNPSIERWMNRDPLGEEGGINLYGFVANDPVNAIDPEGLEIFLIGRGSPYINRPGWLRGGRIPRIEPTRPFPPKPKTPPVDHFPQYPEPPPIDWGNGLPFWKAFMELWTNQVGGGVDACVVPPLKPGEPKPKPKPEKPELPPEWWRT